MQIVFELCLIYVTIQLFHSPEAGVLHWWSSDDDVQMIVMNEVKNSRPENVNIYANRNSTM